MKGFAFCFALFLLEVALASKGCLPNHIQNGGFEKSDIGEQTELPQTPSQMVWETSAGSGMVRIGKGSYGQAAPGEGSQFAILNPGFTIFQDVETVPGSKMVWSVFVNVKDMNAVQPVLTVRIGTPSSLHTQKTNDKKFGYITGEYEVPAGQTVTRFALVPTSGEVVVDDIKFGTAVCKESARNDGRMSAPTSRLHSGISSELPNESSGCRINKLVNAGFEAPVVADIGESVFSPGMPGWTTTRPSDRIWLWKNGFFGEKSYEGDQFVAVPYHNSIFQDIPTVGGATLYWKVMHRSRRVESDPLNVVSVLIGNHVDAATPSGSLADTFVRYEAHEGTYTVPEGQNRTRFAIYGHSKYNFVDSVEFGTYECAGVRLNKHAVERAGGSFKAKFSATVTNGGKDINDLQLVAKLPSGLSCSEAKPKVKGLDTGLCKEGVMKVPLGSLAKGGNDIIVSYELNVVDPAKTCHCLSLIYTDDSGKHLTSSNGVKQDL